MSANRYDAFAPAEMAARVEGAGVAKANLPALETLALALLAGAFVSLGAALYTLVMTAMPLGFGLGRWIGGFAFSLGLVMVLVGGAELFTGNNLIVMAWASRKVTGRQLLRNWGLVYLGNFAGALGTAMLVLLSGTLSLGDGAFAETAAEIARAKIALDPFEAFVRGILCNVLVCLAVWLCFAAHDVTGKVLAIVFPIAAFVALGFEHSIANMYLIPVGLLGQGSLDFGAVAHGLLVNLVPVSIGNMVGGGLLVAGVYWVIYLRRRR